MYYLRMSNSPHNPSKAHSYLAAIITSSDDAIISKDLNGNITSWNPAAEKIFGYTEEEAVGKHISLIIPPDRLSEEEYILGKIKKGERLDHFEAQRRTKSGSMVSLSITVSPIRDDHGVIIGASKVARDISTLKDAERTNAYLGAIIESSDDAILSKDLNGIITSWNISAERIFGFTTEETVGQHITMLIPTERLPEEEQILRQLRAGNRIEHFETMRRHKNGTLIPVSLTVSPIRDSLGTVIGASKVLRNISERIEIQKALKEMSQKKDEFLANMSHELRTPMNAVIGLTNLLKASKTLSERDQKFVETLKVSADNLMELINDLLDFAKIDADSLQFEHIEFSLAEQVQKVITIMSVRAQEKGLKLHLSYAPTLDCKYWGDPLRIHQILANLISNAVKFTHKGRVEVMIDGTKESNGSTHITFAVRDTGVGIPQDKMHLIFDKFTQADPSTTRQFGGSGLGLAITKGLVEGMGGTIGVQSEMNIGTTFTVMLTLKNGEPEAPLDFSAEEAPTQNALHKHILVVEDYEPNILVITAMLDQSHYTYDVVRNGNDALRKFHTNTYDVILMDVQMPELDGFETAQKIRQLEASVGLEPTTIIAMTAHVREQDKKKCTASGMDDFIPKPFEPEMLESKLTRYIK